MLKALGLIPSTNNPDVVVQSPYSKDGAEGSQVQGLLWLHSEFKTSVHETLSKELEGFGV